MPDVYAITNWNSYYENNRSRSVSDLRWCPIPNRFDGDRISELIHAGGDAVYGAWCAALLVASRCNPRGVLLRSSGQPHTAETLGRITGITSGSFDAMLPLAETLGLMTLESVESGMAPDCHPTVSGVSQNGRERMEGKEGNGGCAGFDLFWDAYPRHSRKVGKAQCKRHWSRNGLDDIAEQVMAGLGRWKASSDWTKDDGAFICGPHRWLNERRWEADVEPDKAAAKRSAGKAFDALGAETHRELLDAVRAADPATDHRMGSMDTQRAMRKLARERGLM